MLWSVDSLKVLTIALIRVEIEDLEQKEPRAEGSVIERLQKREARDCKIRG